MDKSENKQKQPQASDKQPLKDSNRSEFDHIDSISDVPDLDGDGMIGHTGGMYGDTTYTGGSITTQTEFVKDAPGTTDDRNKKNEEED